MKVNVIKLWSMGALVGATLALASCGGGGGSGNSGASGSESDPVLADAGPDQTVQISTTPIILDGSGSTGVESAEWTFYAKPDGSAATISNASSLTAGFVADVIGTYTAKLSINSGKSVDVVNIAVVTPTGAQAKISASSKTLRGEPVTLDASQSVQASTVSWQILSKPQGSSATISNPSDFTASFVPDVSGDYTIELSINGGISTETVTVTAKDVLAKVALAENSTVAARTRFGTSEYVLNFGQGGALLSGGGSKAVSGNAIASYQWEQIAGPSIVVQGSASEATLSFAAPEMAAMQNASDRYKWQIFPISRLDTLMQLRLRVSDNQGNEDSDIFNIYLEDGDQVLRLAHGLKNVPRNALVYLSGPSAAIDGDGKEQAVTDWSWSLSSGTFLDSGAAGSTSQFPRFIPNDSATTYTVTYSSVSAGASGTLNIVVADYVGVGVIGGETPVAPQCGNCHMNGIGKFAIVKDWEGTKHSTVFERSMDLYAALAPEPYLWEFNTVGYNIDAANNGFDDRAAAEAFAFPSTGLSFDQFVDDYPTTMVLSNVQCENCHGPGSRHSGNKNRIAHSDSQFGVCAQCHLQEGEWKNSVHHSTGVKNGDGSYQSRWLADTKCVRCHTARGFNDYTNYGMSGLQPVAEAEAFPGVTCAACHNPHDATNYRQLRVAGQVVMNIDHSTVTAGRAAVCYTCHDGFYQYGQNLCDTDSDGAYDDACTTVETIATRHYESKLHFNSQAVVFEGKGAITDVNGDGKADFTLIPNSYHATANFIVPGATENIKCVTCHMAKGPSEAEDGYQRVGGHSFAVRNGEVQFLKTCYQCHTTQQVTALNRQAHGDYDGDESVESGSTESTEGIQDEVQGLLFALSEKLKGLAPAGTYMADSGTFKLDENVYAPNMLSYANELAYRAAPDIIKRATWNYNLIERDRSYGVHNAAFIVRILQQTYTAVGGNAFNEDYQKAEIRD